MSKSLGLEDMDAPVLISGLRFCFTAGLLFDSHHLACFKGSSASSGAFQYPRSLAYQPTHCIHMSAHALSVQASSHHEQAYGRVLESVCNRSWGQ
jgi:hypothetical protein